MRIACCIHATRAASVAGAAPSASRHSSSTSSSSRSVWRSSASTICARRAAARRSVRTRAAGAADSGRDSRQSAVGTGGPIRTSARPSRKVPGCWKTRPTGSSVTSGPAGASLLGGEEHARRAGADFLEDGLGLRAAFREDEDRAPGAERCRGRGERARIAGGIVPRLLAPMDRQRPDQAEERADQRMAEERRVRQGAQGPRDRHEQEHRVHDRIVVIGRDDQRSRGRNVLDADDLDAGVEEIEEEARERANEPISRSARSRRLRHGPRRYAFLTTLISPVDMS